MAVVVTSKRKPVRRTFAAHPTPAVASLGNLTATSKSARPPSYPTAALAAMVGALAGILFGYIFFSNYGRLLDSGIFSIWLKHNLSGPVWLWALSGAFGGLGIRFLVFTRT